RLEAFEKVNFFANVGGILLPSSKVIKKGTYVRKGELLFDIDQRKAEYQLLAQRSQLLNTITLMMPDLKLDYPETFPKWSAYLEAFDVEKDTPDFPKYESAKEKSFIATRGIQQQFYNIKNGEATLADFKIYAPFSGVITQALIYPGTMVNPGQQLGAMINNYSFELETAVNERELSYVDVGAKVSLQGSLPNQEWMGTVQRIGTEIDPVTQNIPLFISVSGKQLKSGMYLSGTIAGRPLAETVTLPKSMIIDQNFVLTVADSVVQRFELDIVKRDEAYVYVRNLEPDQWVIYSSLVGLFEGQKVIPEQKTEE
nr:HlyD family efflux transporter periplasmic adaptor subunit [Saprospiraceae bacterium]